VAPYAQVNVGVAPRVFASRRSEADDLAVRRRQSLRHDLSNQERKRYRRVRPTISGRADGPPMQLIVYLNAYHGFDLLSLQKPVTYFGHHIEFNKVASEQSRDALREFLKSMVQGSR
jgi:dienelactone hydrolase